MEETAQREKREATMGRQLDGVMMVGGFTVRPFEAARGKC
jgi:hypothetical protein